MKIDVKGVIVSNDEQFVYDMFEMDSTSPKDVEEVMKNANGENLEVFINSGGGDVHTASEIYTKLKSYSGNVEVKIVGLSASAASVISMAGDVVKISPTASMMVHNSAATVLGDHNAMDKASEMLKTTNKTIANAYRLKTGMSEGELLDLMNKTTWLSPQDAKSKGFVDEIMFEDSSIRLSANVSNAIPQQVIDKVRNDFATNSRSAVINARPSRSNEEIENMKKDIIDELTTKLKNNIYELDEEPTQEPENNDLSKLFLNL